MVQQVNRTFVKGSKVIVMDKQHLIDEHGADEFGNPNTIVKINRQSGMDHFYGARATVVDITPAYIEIDIDDKIPGQDYEWAVSADMLALDDGTYIGTLGSTIEPVRSFMPRTVKPSIDTLWRNLAILKKKEALVDGQIAFIASEYLRLEPATFKRFIEYTPIFKTSSHLSDAEALKEYYPEIDIEHLACLCLAFSKQDATTKDMKEMFLSLPANKRFKAEFSLVPLTPYKRITGYSTATQIDKLWDNLVFNDSLIENTKISSEDTLQSHIKNVVINYMNDNKIFSLTDQIIEVN